VLRAVMFRLNGAATLVAAGPDVVVGREGVMLPCMLAVVLQRAIRMRVQSATARANGARRNKQLEPVRGH